MFWNHVEVCNVFCLGAMRKNMCYQTIGKAISAGFKMQNFQARFQALSKYSRATLHYSPATAICNETPDIWIISSPHSWPQGCPLAAHNWIELQICLTKRNSLKYNFLDNYVLQKCTFLWLSFVTFVWRKFRFWKHVICLPLPMWAGLIS